MCAAAPRLRRLDFSRSGTFVSAPTVGGPELTCLIGTRCEHLQDEAVSAACLRSPRLVTLKLALCTSLHSPRLQGASLFELNLSGCAQLQDAALTFLCHHAPALSKLSLNVCTSLVSPHLKAPSLTRLECSHCEKLTLPEVGGESLEEVCFAGCVELDDEALEAMCASSPKLLRLNISGCSKLGAATIHGPQLKLLSAHGVDRRVVDAASDRVRCPALRKIAFDAQSDEDGESELEEIN